MSIWAYKGQTGLLYVFLQKLLVVCSVSFCGSTVDLQSSNSE